MTNITNVKKLERKLERKTLPEVSNRRRLTTFRYTVAKVVGPNDVYGENTLKVRGGGKNKRKHCKQQVRWGLKKARRK